MYGQAPNHPRPEATVIVGFLLGPIGSPSEDPNFILRLPCCHEAGVILRAIPDRKLKEEAWYGDGTESVARAIRPRRAESSFTSQGIGAPRGRGCELVRGRG